MTDIVGANGRKPRDLTDYTKEDLLKLAKSEGIPVSSRHDKNKIIWLIRIAQGKI